jgi:hypothetical protein
LGFTDTFNLVLRNNQLIQITFKKKSTALHALPAMDCQGYLIFFIKCFGILFRAVTRTGNKQEEDRN